MAWISHKIYSTSKSQSWTPEQGIHHQAWKSHVLRERESGFYWKADDCWGKWWLSRRRKANTKDWGLRLCLITVLYSTVGWWEWDGDLKCWVSEFWHHIELIDFLTEYPFNTFLNKLHPLLHHPFFFWWSSDSLSTPIDSGSLFLFCSLKGLGFNSSTLASSQFKSLIFLFSFLSLHPSFLLSLKLYIRILKSKKIDKAQVLFFFKKKSNSKEIFFFLSKISFDKHQPPTLRAFDFKDSSFLFFFAFFIIIKILLLFFVFFVGVCVCVCAFLDYF